MPTKLEARVTQHDREIAAIRKLLLQGAKMLVRIEAAQERADRRFGSLEKRIDALDKRVNDLAATVDRFVRSLERGGGNGRGKTDIH